MFGILYILFDLIFIIFYEVGNIIFIIEIRKLSFGFENWLGKFLVLFI